MGSGKSAVGRGGVAGRGCADRAEKVLVTGAGERKGVRAGETRGSGEGIRGGAGAE